MSQRKRRNDGSAWYELHALPFLSIMLGMICVMALTTMAITVQRRKVVQKKKFVELANVPANVIPVPIVCDKNSVSWQEKGEWKTLNMGNNFGSSERFQLLNQFLFHIKELGESNHQLSFKGKQHSIVLWIRPTGGRTALSIQALITEMGMPLRIGKLPLLENENLKSVDKKGGF